MKDEYRSRAWVQAIQQHRPLRDPPEHVTLHAMFLMCRKMRDEDNLKGSLKFTLDALRQKQTGKMRWRHGLFPSFGYLIDDDPAHMTLGDVWQERCASRDWEELIIEIVETK
jgi:hypothetical protein